MDSETDEMEEEIVRGLQSREELELQKHNEERRHENKLQMISCGILLSVFLMSAGLVVWANMADSMAPASTITWAHAVNSQEELAKALASTVNMIEADVSLGWLHDIHPELHKKFSNSTQSDQIDPIPIMAHPPADMSDLSLEQFLTTVSIHGKKGIKLDFKSTEVFNKSIELVERFSNKFPSQSSTPMWLNADIIPGPVNSITTPVDADTFLQRCHELLPTNVLSVGWTTNFDGDHMNGKYTSGHVQAMIDALTRNKILEAGQSITYPVRAGLAVNSLSEMTILLENQKATLTLWSGKDDPVDPGKVRNLIDKLDENRVYIDLPFSVQKNSASTVAISSVLAIVTTLMSLH